MPTMGAGRHTLRLERLRGFPLVVTGTENLSLVKNIATAARRLVANLSTIKHSGYIAVGVDRDLKLNTINSTNGHT